MKNKSMHQRRSKTRKYTMYGGAPAPAPAFSGFGYTNAELYTSLNNYLQAAHSIKIAANAIKDTSINQNSSVTGTRVLQKMSSDSFGSAASSMKNSLDRLYQSFTNTSISLPPLPSPPPTAPPPYVYSPPPM
jgi:hypothetical protein